MTLRKSCSRDRILLGTSQMLEQYLKSKTNRLLIHLNLLQIWR
jgi:hypothetical protein